MHQGRRPRSCAASPHARRRGRAPASCASARAPRKPLGNAAHPRRFAGTSRRVGRRRLLARRQDAADSSQASVIPRASRRSASTCRDRVRDRRPLRAGPGVQIRRLPQPTTRGSLQHARALRRAGHAPATGEPRRPRRRRSARDARSSASTVPDFSRKQPLIVERQEQRIAEIGLVPLQRCRGRRRR